MDFRALKCTTFSCVVSSNAIKTNMVRYLVLKQFIEAKETLKQFCNFQPEVLLKILRSKIKLERSTSPEKRNLSNISSKIAFQINIQSKICII